jgi:hypothetical protein
MATTFKYHRFADLDAMKAGAHEIVKAYWHANEEFDHKPFCEAGIYTDNNGLSYRPQVSIVTDKGVHVLKWNAFCDQPDVDHIGRRARVEARDAADWFTHQIQEMLNLFNAIAFREEPAAASECNPCLWSELTEYEKAEANFRGFPRGADIRYVAKRKYDQEAGELSLTMWTRVADKPAAAEEVRDLCGNIVKPNDPDFAECKAAAQSVTAEQALREIWELLNDWPTMRALSASGAQKATANKQLARALIAAVLQPATVNQGANFAAALEQVEAFQEEAATLDTIDSVWFAIMETTKQINAVDDVERLKEERNTSGSRLNVLFRMSRVYRRSEKAAGSFNFIGVGRISFAQGRLSVFKRRALRAYSRRLISTNS